jgi:hypothetical protein
MNSANLLYKKGDGWILTNDKKLVKEEKDMNLNFLPSCAFMDCGKAV